ncbi:hypothetical protein FDP41_000592 [Naegleria fowleri]|uniref:Sugar phosphate transporter domain-containing protein n=1 Tax=Naegleria fowleri TaxID=5763 RepID=A0A6A5C2P4_NAEFO|nr:uncharacterized protein FDP41_000592 [Naegleria fowleri]KAF0984693.1 hypothetical protein FDP41_000592 [Naegleria fowleri]CAG4708481.1 unnamed protein product [Naegleria fowleri]
MSQINQRGIGDGMTPTTSPISNPSNPSSSSSNPPAPTMMGVIGSISLNIAASVGTIFINKHLFQNLGFVGLGTTLTVFHFIFCFVFTGLTAMLGIFQPKRLPLLKVLPISLAFCGYVVFNNISLAYNSVSFYQVMKIMCTPCIILIEYFFYRKTPDRRILFPLIPVCVGTFITVFTDLEMNYYGTIMAILAVLTNSMYTIYGTEKQKELKANSLQILLYQSIMSAVILSVTIPFFDDMEVLPEYDFRDANNLFWIIFSCVTAFFVNVSFFLVAGKTSPLSVNVVGYFKTVLVFIGGIMLFTDIVSAKNLLGVTLTLLGVAWYTYEKYKITQESVLVLPTTNK